MIGYITSAICSAITFGMALLHLLLLFGAPLGEYVLGGEDRVMPLKKRVVNGFCCLLFSLSSIAFLQRGNILTLNINPLIGFILIIIIMIFTGCAIFFNSKVTRSKKENLVMTPLSAITFICSLILLITSWQ